MPIHAWKTPSRRYIVSRIVDINTDQAIALLDGSRQHTIIVKTQVAAEPDDDCFHSLTCAILPSRRQRSEQYFTLSQFLAQDFRQVIGRPQTAQDLEGRDCLLPRKPPRSGLIGGAQPPALARLA
jgi:3-phenylpropionate/cinnamic acid dioxygenase small subunit